jgi:hypothetical protein
VTNRKNNSALFLTTLGVYLGLMLVGGAAPQVFAHGALTRNFDLQDEIEISDDLEKKPDLTEKELGDVISDYSREIQDFVENLRKLRSIDQFDGNWITFDSKQTTYSPCPETGGLLSETTEGHIDRWLVPAITEAKFIAENFAWLGDCLPHAGIENRSLAKSAGIKLKYDKTGLTHEVSIKFESEKKAHSLHEGLSSAFAKFEIDGEDDDFALKKVLLKHTSLTTSANQIFITTRLPRADLDPLLTSRAK